MRILFFFSAFVIFYIYAGYPLLLAILSLFFIKPIRKSDIFPFVTIFAFASNEGKDIEEAVKELLEVDYPPDRREIIVGCDGVTEETHRLLQRLSQEKNIRYAVAFQPVGRHEVTNKMAKDAKGEIYVFTDTRQRLDRGAVRELVRCFGDEAVGAVSGTRVVGVPGSDGAAPCRDCLRKMESALGSTLESTGAPYAVRREYFRYLPSIILEDVYTPMNAILLDKRVVFEPAAKAHDVLSGVPQERWGRKVHILVGYLEIFSMFPEAFDPFKCKVAVALFSRHFLKFMAPCVLFTMFVSSCFLFKKGPFFVWAHFLQVGFYCLAFLGYLVRKSARSLAGGARFFYVPYEFCLSNFAAVAALKEFLRRGAKGRVQASGTPP